MIELPLLNNIFSSDHSGFGIVGILHYTMCTTPYISCQEKIQGLNFTVYLGIMQVYFKETFVSSGITDMTSSSLIIQ